MPATPFDLVMFDFDGTLVDSAAAKRAAFFKLFPETPAHRAIVEDVLRDDPDGSRYAVIPRMVAAMQAQGVEVRPPDACIAAYAQAALDAVATSAEIPGAGDLLRALKGRCAVYLCSATPDEPLKHLVALLGWEDCFDGVYGYPARKPETLLALLEKHRVAPARAAVVGDDESDARAAAAAGCTFFRIREPRDLSTIARSLGAGHV